MRRVAVLLVVVALTLTGVATCGAASPGRTAGAGAAASAGAVARVGAAASAGATARVRAAASAGAAARGPSAAGYLPGTGRVRVLRYGGYQVTVPAAWPVYRLGPGSSRCVRYDRHAVYLGRPGAYQLCPAHLAGRVTTVSLAEPGLSPGTAGRARGTVRRAVPRAGAGRGPRARLRLTPAQRRVGARLLRDPGQGQFWALFPRGGLTVTVTYGGGLRLASAIVRTVHWVPRPRSGRLKAAHRHRPVPGPLAAGGRWATHGRQPASRRGEPAAASAGPGRRVDGAPPGRAGAALAAVHRRDAHRRDAHRRDAHRQGGHRRRHHRTFPQRGFDTCTAPPLRVMRVWRQVFSAAAIYVGGPESACAWGNLSRHWVRAAVRMGWALIPAYVGPQAPCTRFSVRIRPGHAEVEGRAAARQAIGLARLLGLRRGAPLYDDMEAYDGARPRCRHPVLAFLDGWTRELHARGWRAGVYSSAAAAPEELGLASTVYGHRLAKPNSVWFALWDGHANLSGIPYMLATWWGGDHRIKQYRGGHRRRIGGVRLNVDSDLVYGAVYR
jgi:glycoside hydrolase-like protein